jgi:type I protein arginine methyltransferase
MYTLLDYGLFIRDRRRVDRYAAALRRAVTPGSVVVDIGTGTGIFALLACKFGARRVYAIEPGDVIQVAREIAAANGYTDRVQFIHRESARATLAEPADVIVSDLRDVLPLFGQHLPTVIHARRHFLAAGGTLIPELDTLWVAPAHAPALYGRYAGPWEGNGYGLDMRAGRRAAVNRWRKGRVAPEQLLAEPKSWARLDYAGLQSPDVHGAVSWTIGREGTAHGLSAWFDSTLAEGIRLSNAPGEPELVYGTAFFPFTAPLALAPGDTMSVDLGAELVGDDYVWRWDTRLSRGDEPDLVKADFKQSTVPEGAPAGWPSRGDSDRVPTLGHGGELDRFILTRMDGATSLGEIARQVWLGYGGRFSTWRDALTYVGDLSDRYSREPADRGHQSASA